MSLYRKNEPITVITAHDFPSAHVADQAGIDIVLVGDSLAMVALGMDDTSEVLMEEMLLHCRSVARGARSAFIVGDLPMGTYEISPDQALQSAITMVKTGRVHGIKLEGGAEMAPTIKKITSAGIPVLAHVGLTPQRQNKTLRDTIANHQLITRLEAPPQIPHALIKTRSKHLIHIAKHTFMRLQRQLLA
ncbi:ketopantoate hydroxymethyltransferase, partial [Aureobasidium melanogenum]